jgi:hypothetical protein
VDGLIYTLGKFDVNGGGGVLNVNGGVWAGGGATMNGTSSVTFKATYMSAVSAMGINAGLQIISWTDTQNPS